VHEAAYGLEGLERLVFCLARVGGQRRRKRASRKAEKGRARAESAFGSSMSTLAGLSALLAAVRFEGGATFQR
jgi:hypothetical protein